MIYSPRLDLGIYEYRKKFPPCDHKMSIEELYKPGLLLKGDSHEIQCGQNSRDKLFQEKEEIIVRDLSF